MTQHSMSLIDVLAPPANQWLKELSKRKTNLPAGVRIVRFGDEDDDGFEKSQTADGLSASRSK